MKITQLEPFILHAPVTRRQIADSTHQLTHWGAPGVIIRTDAGVSGYGYTGTHAHLPGDRLITDCIAHAYGPLLIDQNPLEIQHLWRRLYHYPPLQWIGRGGVTQLALSAIDVALWDIKAKVAGLPLWQLLGGSAAKTIEGYNTDGGWLNWSLDQLVDDCRALVETHGYRGVKIKVGSPDPYDDLQRIEAVRRAIGPRIKLMVDANGRWDLTTALTIGRHFADYDIRWFEEPIWYDDLDGHAALAQKLATPLALGEQLYSLDDFRNFIRAGAVHYVQPDAVRLAGITEWWQVADLALAHRLPVVSHIGDMVQVHLHLAIAHPACHMLEYIPWLNACFEEPATVIDGDFIPPQNPGAGTTLTEAALEMYDVLRRSG
ncbi:MAG: mandelate racemase/muconate lactonizing enzyme family protein [Anaerolineae bacterium]|nr:mandelate racemase/muconate lactonizing enzyme family protein [Anaerolineae bacterium]